MIEFQKPKLIKIYKVSKGKIWYVCSCGRQASELLIHYKRHLRCKNCSKVNSELINSGNIEPATLLESSELFEKFYLNGLLDYVEGAINE